MADVVVFVVLAAATAGIGAVGGLGGAVILVPTLVLLGWSPIEAAPLGLISVAAGSVAAGPRQLRLRSINHRLGVTTELVATTGAVTGAFLAGTVSDDLLVYGLAAVTGAAALLGFRRKGLRNPAHPDYGEAEIGERVGLLAGAYPVKGGVAPYQARRLPLGLALMSVAGFVAGSTGVSGGFIKTPAMSEVMHVPTKVAAATTTFTAGITSSAALIVLAFQGAVDVRHSSAVIVGSLAGGVMGASVQGRLSPWWVRRALSVVLMGIAVVMVVAR
jgi:hypothetical protein